MRRCARVFCLATASRRVTILSPEGRPELADDYCFEHAYDLRASLIPRYLDGKPAVVVEEIGQIVHVRSWRWCWHCFLPRRFHEKHCPPLDGTIREGVGWFEDARGHVR